MRGGLPLPPGPGRWQAGEVWIVWLRGVQRVYGLAGGSRGEDALYSWAEGRSCISWNSIAKELFLRLAGDKN